MSAVIREIIDLHQVEGIQLLRKERLIRTSVWVPPEIWGAFRAKTEQDGITLASRSQTHRFRDSPRVREARRRSPGHSI